MSEVIASELHIELAGPGFCQCGCGERTRLLTQNDASKGWKRGEYLRFIDGHNRRSSPFDCVIDHQTGCWVWQKHRDPNGYGRVNGRGTSSLAHRVYYEEVKGPIPEGLQLDHLCRNPACVNPDHLEPVTNAENSRRGDMTRLTPEQVREIRSSSEPSNKKLAAKYGVHPVYIWQIKARRKWRDLD